MGVELLVAPKPGGAAREALVGPFVRIKVTLLINHYNKNELANYFQNFRQPEVAVNYSCLFFLSIYNLFIIKKYYLFININYFLKEISCVNISL